MLLYLETYWHQNVSPSSELNESHDSLASGTKIGISDQVRIFQ